MKRFKYKDLATLDTERKRMFYGKKLVEYYKLKKGYGSYYITTTSRYSKVLEVVFTDWNGRPLKTLFFSNYAVLIEAMTEMIKSKK